MAHSLHNVQQTVKPIVAHHEIADSAFMAQNFGMQLARLRQLRGLSQRDLAEMIKVNASTVHRAEISHPSAKLQTFQKCADALGITLADIFAADLSPVQRDVVALLDQLDPDRQGQLFQMILLASGLAASTDQVNDPSAQAKVSVNS